MYTDGVLILEAIRGINAHQAIQNLGPTLHSELWGSEAKQVL